MDHEKFEVLFQLQKFVSTFFQPPSQAKPEVASTFTLHQESVIKMASQSVPQKVNELLDKVGVVSF